MTVCVILFFFQAEDGIRDHCVTGVQTCALPISWRATVKVPAFGTEAAAAFSCPWVGGAPGVAGPDAQAVAELSAMLKGGNRNVPELVRLYKNAVPDASPDDVV